MSQKHDTASRKEGHRANSNRIEHGYPLFRLLRAGLGLGTSAHFDALRREVLAVSVLVHESVDYFPRGQRTTNRRPEQ